MGLQCNCNYALYWNKVSFIQNKSISNRGAFSCFSKNETSALPQFAEHWIDNFLKITAWNRIGSHFVLLWSVGVKKSAKLQNTCVHRENWFILSFNIQMKLSKLICVIQFAGWSANPWILKMSAESLSLSQLIYSQVAQARNMSIGIVA